MISSAYYICHTYDSFQKDQIEKLSENIFNVNVFVRSNHFFDILAHISSQKYGKYSTSRKINKLGLPNNCGIYPTSVLYAPCDFDYLRMGERHFKSVCKTIRQNQVQPPSLVHSHFLWSSGYVGKRLKEEYDVPFIATGHGYDVYDLPFRSDAWRRRICDVLNSADHIITVSYSNLACLEKLDIETPVSVIPNGFDDKIFYPRNKDECRVKLNLPLDKKILLTVGNCVAIKGHRYLIEAMKMIHTDHPDVLCVIVGSGELYATEMAMISRLGLSECVWMVGGKPHEEIPLWMNACDVFVLPSLNEGNPTVLVEALGCGKPFVGTRVGGVPEMICSEEYGILCEAGNVGGLFWALEEALKRDWDPGCIVDYTKKFKWGDICKEIENIYWMYLV